jgi:hypothetical protein
MKWCRHAALWQATSPITIGKCLRMGRALRIFLTRRCIIASNASTHYGKAATVFRWMRVGT